MLAYLRCIPHRCKGRECDCLKSFGPVEDTMETAVLPGGTDDTKRNECSAFSREILSRLDVAESGLFKRHQQTVRWPHVVQFRAGVVYSRRQRAFYGGESAQKAFLAFVSGRTLPRQDRGRFIRACFRQQRHGQFDADREDR